MAPLSDYVTGTITLTNGSAAFTGTGTGWLAAAFREGDTVLGIEDNPGVTYVIESITDNDAGTLTQPWGGPTGTYEYRMRYLADGQRVTAQARTLIELLGNGNLQALAGLSGTPNTLAMFTGAGAMVEVPRTDLVSGVAYDVQVATLPDRGAYDGQDAGFAVLVSDTGDGRAAIFSRVEGGGWSDAAYVTGPAVTLDVGSVTPVAFGNDPDVTLNPVAGGYEFDFDLPENAAFQSGTITTLNPGEDATFSLSPVAGGYALNLGVPRGPTGDIDGVTPFWQGRIRVDADAEAARAGLGAVGGPTSAGDGQIAIFDGTTGALIKDSGLKPEDIGSVDQLFTDDLTGDFDDSEKAQARANIDAYGKDNILGTVSEVAGVPTGAIIERGSNANGEYIKFADGTLICTKSIAGVGPINNGWGELFIVPQPYVSPGLYAESFVAMPSVVCSSSSMSGQSAFAVQVNLPTLTDFGRYFLCRGTSSNATDFILNLVAIGRWF